MLALALTLGLLAQAPTVAQQPADLLDLTGLARVGIDGSRRFDAATIRDTEPAEYLVESAARARLVYMLPPGPRTVRELTVVPTAATADAWRVARLRITWDSDDPAIGPGVDLPLGLLFGRFGPDAGLGETALAGSDGPAWRCRFPMPYHTQALLEIEADRPIVGKIRLRSTSGIAPGTGFLRGVVVSPRTGLSEVGRGRLAGVFLVSGLPREGDRHPEMVPGHLALDGRDRGPLTEAVGLPDREDQAGTSTAGIVRNNRCGALARFRWLTGDPLAYDRAMAVGLMSPRGAVRLQPDEDGNGRAAPASRVVVFWYSDRPRIGAIPSISGAGTGHGGR